MIICLGVIILINRVLKWYRTLLTIRKFSDILKEKSLELISSREITWLIHLPYGQEAVAVGVVEAINEKDLIVPHFRNYHWAIARGIPLEKIFGEILGKSIGTCRGKAGELHGSLEHNYFPATSIVGANMPIAVGLAYAEKFKGTNRVVVNVIGDSYVNIGAFHESINMASLWNLPIVFLVENNHYGMSTHYTKVTANKDIIKRATAYGIPGIKIDGKDVFEVYYTAKKVIEGIRESPHPVLIEADACRHGGSISLDKQRYRSKEEIEACLERDPLTKLKKFIEREGIADEERLYVIDKEVEEQVNKAWEKAINSPPTNFEEVKKSTLKLPSLKYREELNINNREDSSIVTMRKAINLTIREIMEEDPRVILIGEEVGLFGGDFKVTEGLYQEFGEWRVRDTPVAEYSIIGMAIGCAAGGLRPIAEIMWMDFIGLAADQILNHLTKLPYISNEQVKLPLMIRTPYGVGMRTGPMHSQSLEAWFVHLNELYVVAPSTPYDARGLLFTFTQVENPVLFLEHKLLYDLEGPIILSKYYTPIGKARIVRKGESITVVSWGRMVHVVNEVAEVLKEKKNIEVELIDLRTLKPLDMKTIMGSVEKTGKLLVVQETWPQCSIGSEILASVSEELGSSVRKMRRLSMLDLPVPSGKVEDLFVPSKEEITKTIIQMVNN